MCQRWFVKFRAGDFLLANTPLLDKPVEVDREQIEILIKNNQYYCIWKIGDVLKIYKLMKLLVKMKMCHFTEKNKRTFWPTQHLYIF